MLHTSRKTSPQVQSSCAAGCQERLFSPWRLPGPRRKLGAICSGLSQPCFEQGVRWETRQVPSNPNNPMIYPSFKNKSWDLQYSIVLSIQTTSFQVYHQWRYMQLWKKAIHLILLHKGVTRKLVNNSFITSWKAEAAGFLQTKLKVQYLK